MGQRLLPIKWKELVRKLQQFGFSGPFVGGRHPYMTKGNLVLTIPNPHKGDVGIQLLLRILKQARVSKEDWLNQ